MKEIKTDYTFARFISNMYWLFAVIYGFILWGFWWGMLSIILPILPIIDFVKHFFK